MSRNRDPEDRETVRRVLQGDRNAFRLLVERYQPAVCALGRRMLRGPWEDLSDYVQEVFLKAFCNLSQYTGDGRFYSWLMRISYTTALNRARRKAPEESSDPQLIVSRWPAPETSNPEHLTLRRTLLESIVEAIRELPEASALAVELFFVMKLTYAEISEITGVPINTLKSRVCRARQLLQKRLGDELLEESHDL
ncbi:MAG: RNA polymerase sigma factor [Alkalispirochaetaceae bacterium]